MRPSDSGMQCPDGCGKLFPYTGWTIPGVIAPGTAVRLADQIDGTVIGVMLEAAGHLTYHVAYWFGGKRETTWCEDHELALLEPDAMPIRMGFITPPVKPAAFDPPPPAAEAATDA
jgi:hypothetical protein